MGFEQEIRSKGFDVEQSPKLWFYISFVNNSGAFMGAVVAQGSDRVEALFSQDQDLLLPDGAKMGNTIEIPDDKLPPEEFCNRLLTRAEVEALWPEVKL